MKRDMVLVRKVLEFVEEFGSRIFKGAIKIEGYDRDAIIYHLQLLVTGDFVQLGSETLTNMGILVLTWKGCDYLDQLRMQSTAKA
jgi:hypothetical protein